LDKSDFTEVGEADLQELVDNGVPESERIEYKRELYGRSDAEKRELLKDVSALLNARGGHLVVGIGAEAGLPIGPIGVACEDADEEKLRIVSILRMGLDPTPLGIQVREVRLANGSYCFVVRVPQSWHGPHRVSAQGVNRFYTRNPGGVHEPSVTELRHMFGVGQDAIARARAFREERIRRIAAPAQARPLQGNGRFLMHLVPLASVSSGILLNLADVSRRQDKFRPMGAVGYSPRFNFDGFLNERGGDLNHGYTQVFRNGSVEAAKASLTYRPERPPDRIDGRGLESQIFEVLPTYLEALSALGIPAPILVMCGLYGVAGVQYATRDNYRDTIDGPRVFEQETLELPECVIQDYGTVADYQRALRPALDAIWNAMERFTDPLRL
jgi:hypothetical protein